MKIMDLRWS